MSVFIVMNTVLLLVLLFFVIRIFMSVKEQLDAVSKVDVPFGVDRSLGFNIPVNQNLGDMYDMPSQPQEAEITPDDVTRIMQMISKTQGTNV